MNNLQQTSQPVKSYLSGYAVKQLLRMAEFSKWSEWWDAPPKGLEETIADLRKSGLEPETCQKAKLIPLTYFLRQWEEDTARSFIKNITRLSSSKSGGRDLLKDGELLGFPYFSKDGELLFVRIRAYPPLVFRDEDGKEREVKYLQPKGVPALPYILPEVWKVSQKAHKPLWIVEGEKKALSLIQHGRYAIALSGVWNFRSGEQTARSEEDLQLWKELRDFVWAGRIVYLGFDMDLWTNPQVRLALFELGLKLYSLGAIVKVCLWDRKLKGIDDFLSQQAEELDKIEERAKKLWDIAEPEDLDRVVRALSKVELSYEHREQIYKVLSKRLSVKPETLERAVWKAIQETEEQTQPFSEELKKEAERVLKGDVVGRFLTDTEKLYARREKEKVLLYLTVMSRKVKNLPLNLMVVLRGASSEGKSSLARTILSLIASEDTMEISYQSRAYLYYGLSDLSHKVLFLTELEGSSKGLYGLKLVITEGELLVRSVEATKHGLKAINRRIPAYSMPVITTGVNPQLDEELQTRGIVLSLSSDEDLRYEALKVKTLINQEEKARIRELWRAVDSLIEPAEVSIPWIDKLVNAMKGRLVQGRYLRDFDKFIGLVMASALVHQHQRQKDDKGRIIAQREDYELVWGLQKLFTETFGGLPENIQKVVEAVKSLTKTSANGEEVLPKKSDVIAKLVELTGKTERTAREWLDRAKAMGYIKVYGRGKAGATVSLTLEEIPQPEFPFPSSAEVFGECDKRESGTMADYGQSLENQGLEFAMPEMAYSVRYGKFEQYTSPEKDEGKEPNKEICHNMPNTAWQIKTIEPQGSEANLPSCHSHTIENFSDEGDEVDLLDDEDLLSSFMEVGSPHLRTQKESQRKSLNHWSDLANWKPAIKPESLTNTTINITNLGQVKENLKAIAKLLPPKFSMDYELQGFKLSVYLENNTSFASFTLETEPILLRTAHMSSFSLSLPTLLRIDHMSIPLLPHMLILYITFDNLSTDTV